jgi:ketosteroid isomerase-like protein
VAFIHRLRPQRFIGILLAAWMLTISAQEHALPQELTNTVDAYFDAWIDGRIPEMVSHLTADSEYHPNGGASVSGREALRGLYQDFVDNYDISLRWQYEQAEVYGDRGYVMGVYFIRYAPTGSREEIARGGRFFMDMRLDSDRRWRIRRELTQTTDDAYPEFQAGP